MRDMKSMTTPEALTNEAAIAIEIICRLPRLQTIISKFAAAFFQAPDEYVVVGLCFSPSTGRGNLLFPTPSLTITSTFSAATQMTVVCLQLAPEAGTGACERQEGSGARRENELSRSGSSSTQLKMGEVKLQRKSAQAHPTEV